MERKISDCYTLCICVNTKHFGVYTYIQRKNKKNSRNKYAYRASIMSRKHYKKNCILANLQVIHARTQLITIICFVSCKNCDKTNY